MTLMLIRFDPGDQFPYLVIWFPFVFDWRLDDAMTMLGQKCRSTVTVGTFTSLHLQSFRKVRTAIHTLYQLASFGSDGIFMELTLLLVIGSELFMKQGMDVNCALFYATAPTVSSRC